MTGIEVLAIAIGEGLAMVGRLVHEWTKAEGNGMTASQARELADTILADVALDEAIERRQFERLQAQREQAKKQDDQKG